MLYPDELRAHIPSRDSTSRLTKSTRYTPGTEVYKQETREILRRFLEQRMSYSECIAALDAALVGIVLRVDAADLPAVRGILVSNGNIVKAALTQRGLE